MTKVKNVEKVAKVATIDEKVAAEVALVLGDASRLPMDKAARLLAKSYSHDANKIGKFLDADFSQGLTSLMTAQKRDALFEKVDKYGITDTKKKQALAIHILRSDAKATAQAKVAELTANREVSDELKAAIAKKAAQYETWLVDTLVPAIMDVGKALNVIEYKEQEAAAKTE